MAVQFRQQARGQDKAASSLCVCRWRPHEDRFSLASISFSASNQSASLIARGETPPLGAVIGRLCDFPASLVLVRRNLYVGKRDQLSGKIQECYGISKDEAERQIEDWESRQRDIA